MSQNEYEPRILSEEEIDIYLKGDPKDVNRIILYNLNRLATVLIPHVEQEEEWRTRFRDLGGFQSLKKRADYVDSLIKRNDARTAMMQKVSESAVGWALIAFLGFLAMAVWHDIVAAIKMALKAKV